MAKTQNGMTGYYSEMGEKRPDAATIDATLSHTGKHWFLKTALTITGRGVTLLRTLTANDLVPQAQHQVGLHEYKVTDAAFDRIKSEHCVACELLL